jgi:hypothetical protein
VCDRIDFGFGSIVTCFASWLDVIWFENDRPLAQAACAGPAREVVAGVLDEPARGQRRVDHQLL